jgi:hypothetical protein
MDIIMFICYDIFVPVKLSYDAMLISNRNWIIETNDLHGKTCEIDIDSREARVNHKLPSIILVIGYTCWLIHHVLLYIGVYAYTPIDL